MRLHSSECLAKMENIVLRLRYLRHRLWRALACIHPNDNLKYVLSSLQRLSDLINFSKHHTVPFCFLVKKSAAVDRKSTSVTLIDQKKIIKKTHKSCKRVVSARDACKSVKLQRSGTFLSFIFAAFIVSWTLFKNMRRLGVPVHILSTSRLSLWTGQQINGFLQSTDTSQLVLQLSPIKQMHRSSNIWPKNKYSQKYFKWVAALKSAVSSSSFDVKRRFSCSKMFAMGEKEISASRIEYLITSVPSSRY